MKRFGILGHPLKHTMSPYIHKELFRLSGIADFEYDIYDIPEEELDKNLADLAALDGLNITIPYKVRMIEKADEVSPAVSMFRSVNMFMKIDGKTMGYNTDVDGFVRAVAELPATLSGKVLLLGAGGVAQMMAVTAVTAGADLTIAVREENWAQGEALSARASQYGKPVACTLLSKIEGEYDLLINATPVGMYPKIEATPVSDSVIRKVKAVFDAVYNPNETLLVKKARAFSILSDAGMSMLVYQAVKAHELWYGGKFTKIDIDALVHRASEYMEKNFK